MPNGGFFVMEDDIRGGSAHGRRIGLTFYFEDEATYEKVKAHYRKSTHVVATSYQYMDSKKLALTIIPEEDLPDVV